MATTTNFGWETPDDTDLVKDGALAMRTLGNAIDTSLVDLKGGTTGQVLSKTSNTDMDFTWVTSDDANAIQNAIVDAKGDLITATAADTPARLAVGSNGDTLVADSAATTGLRWSQAPSTGNPVINSAMQVWQRGTSFASAASGAYTADRWGYFTSGASNYTISRQTTNDTTNLPAIQYCARLQRASGNTQTAQQYFANIFESINSIPFVGKTVTLSYYARVGADYSGGTGFRGYIASGATTDVSLFGGVATNNVATSAPTLTTTWQRFTATGTVLTTQTQICVYFTWVPSGTAGANDFVEITGVQIDLGSVALPFRTQNSTLQGELAACQRYYYRSATGSGRYGVGFTKTTTTAEVITAFPVTMRTAPSALEQTGTASDFTIVHQNTSTTLSAVPTFNNANVNMASTNLTVASGLTAGNGCTLSAATGNSYLGWSAEL